MDFDDPYLKLDFPSATTLPPPCISVTNVAFGPGYLYVTGEAHLWRLPLATNVFERPHGVPGIQHWTYAKTAQEWEDYLDRKVRPEEESMYPVPVPAI